MVPLLVLASLLVQDGPTILSVEPLTGPAARSGCWYPVVVRLRSPSAFEGELLATADLDYRIRRPVRLEAGAEAAVLIATIPLQEDAKVRVALMRGFSEVAARELTRLQLLGDRERLVLVDRAHPRAAEWDGATIPTDHGPIVLRPRASDPDWWDEAARRGWLDAVDARLGGPPGEGAWDALGGTRVEDFRAPIPRAARWSVIEPQAAALRTSERWIGAKRDAAVLFTVIYAFALFTAVFVTWTRKLGPAALWGGVGGMTALFLVVYVALFPRGDTAIAAHRAVFSSGAAQAAVTVHQVRKGSGPPIRLRSSSAPKPVASSRAELMMVRMDATVGADGCTVDLQSPPEAALLLTLDAGSWSAMPGSVPTPRAVQEFFNRGTAGWQSAGKDPAAAGPFTLDGPGVVDARFRTLIRYERIR